jgi:chromosome segregation ATPase
LADTKQALAGTSERLSATEQTLATMTQERDELQATITNLQKLADERASQVTKAQSAHVKLTEVYDQLRAASDAQREELAQQAKRADQLEQALKATTDQHGAAQDSYAELLRQSQTLEQTNQELEASAKRERQLAEERGENLTALTQTMAQRDQQIADLQTSRTLLLEQVSHLEDDLAGAEQSKRELVKDLELARLGGGESGASRAERDRLREEMRAAQQKVAELAASLKHKEDQLLDTRSALAKAQTESEEAKRTQVAIEQELAQERFNFKREFHDLEKRRVDHPITR